MPTPYEQLVMGLSWGDSHEPRRNRRYTKRMHPATEPVKRIFCTCRDVRTSMDRRPKRFCWRMLSIKMHLTCGERRPVSRKMRLASGDASQKDACCVSEEEGFEQKDASCTWGRRTVCKKMHAAYGERSMLHKKMPSYVSEEQRL